jgi:chemotaxis protein methyltransferase CheR
MKSGIVDTDFTGGWELITERLGLEFPEGRRSTVIRNLVSAAGEFGFDDFDKFKQWLLSAVLNKQEIEKLASFLTISETFFWREHNVFSAFTDFILPELIKFKREGDRTIRIWSAGCSSGEEPYSLAIALQRSIPDIKEWNIKILATDINPKALEKAATGIYTKWSFRNCPSWLQTGYFRNLGKERFEIVPRIKEMVTFRNLNLTEDLFPSFTNDTHAMDIIFCRNVLMYFTDEWVTRISKNLYKSLNKDGWFVVASCELSSYVFPQFTPVNFKDAIVYRKGDKILNGITDQPVLSLHSVTLKNTVTVVDKANPYIVSDHIVEQSEPLLSIDLKVEHIVAAKPLKVGDISSMILKLANLGQLREALSLCNEGIAKDKLNIGLYSLRASILQELDMHNDAIASLKQAIYLDPNFIMGHFALGNLFVRQNKTSIARMHFKNVLDLISNLENDEIIPGSDGLSVKYINDIVKGNLENQK